MKIEPGHRAMSSITGSILIEEATNFSTPARDWGIVKKITPSRYVFF